ncbi:monofunctional biosynthetic peptidoglycan transglycosylase [Uliginosibacterium aquaticum]|uniref:Biosynthetic peptidoglycan transglycosylase n=1 Tax=Uliginosibacterium aquaticum TaxID=2731212 RepID=A0ABX2IPB9_9RHOO|nr:monofunctional biosynthetic peptidoglycan transglycosylase [Uliginosibacterium aquaticum]NSL55965.1 monofunctional biosynthetic peptidoglycan transglycosylase [Uliginosibacterium aquaticum]
MKLLLLWVRRLLLAALLLLVAWHLWLLGWVLWWKWMDPGTTSFMQIRLAELQEKDPAARLKHQWVPYGKISIHLKRAVVAAEDDTFVDHDGFDLEGIQKALEKNDKKGRVVAGGSTISQQLAKNLFLWSGSTRFEKYSRKALEVPATLMIEALWDKRRILEVYLNSVEWGNGIFGAEAAARRYFGTGAGQLAPAQAARLAVMLPNPRKYERNYSPRLAAHAARVQARMAGSEVP